MLAKRIEEDILRMTPDIVFTYRDLGYPLIDSGNVIRKLNRMVESGVLMKLSKGVITSRRSPSSVNYVLVRKRLLRIYFGVMAAL